MLRSTCLGAFFMFMLRSTCFHAFFHVCAQIYMSMCFLLCLCIDVHVYVLFSMFMLRCLCLRTFFHVCTYIYMSMCFFPFPCAPCHVWIKSTYWMLCLVLLQPFCLFVRLFLVFWPLSRVQIQILWSRPISIHLGLHQRVQIISSNACVCLLASMLYIHVCLARSRFLPCFVPSVGLCLLVFGATCFCGCIHPSCGLFRCNHLREHIHVMLVCLMHTFLRSVR